MYALILNAAEKERGVRTFVEKTRQGRNQRVIVELKRENELLIIKNECSQRVDTDEIKRRLKKVPESSEDGISLWSAYVYIQRCKSALVMTRINNVREKLLSNLAMYEDMTNLLKEVESLFDVSGEVTIENRESNGKNYFMVGLPIFVNTENKEDC